MLLLEIVRSHVTISCALVVLVGAVSAPHAEAAGRTRATSKTARAAPASGRTRTQPRPYRPRNTVALRPVRGAKNRGELASLDGLKIGRTFSLVNPSTGRLDHKATIVAKGVDGDTRIPYAWIKFANGAEYYYAAERLQLVGKPLGFQRAYLRKMRDSVRAGIEKHLGISAKGTKITSYRGRNTGPRKRRRVGEPHLGPFLKVLNEHVEPDQQIEAFYRDGKVYQSRHYAAFDPITTTHELIHTLSPGFIRQANSRGLTEVMEGFTEYFTYKVARPYLGARPDNDHGYFRVMGFAAKVAKAVGEERTKQLFFSKDGRSLEKLAARYDAAVGRQGAFFSEAQTVEAASQH